MSIERVLMFFCSISVVVFVSRRYVLSNVISIKL